MLLGALAVVQGNAVARPGSVRAGVLIRHQTERAKDGVDEASGRRTIPIAGGVRCRLRRAHSSCELPSVAVLRVAQEIRKCTAHGCEVDGVVNGGDTASDRTRPPVVEARHCDCWRWRGRRRRWRQWWWRRGRRWKGRRQQNREQLVRWLMLLAALTVAQGNAVACTISVRAGILIRHQAKRAKDGVDKASGRRTIPIAGGIRCRLSGTDSCCELPSVAVLRVANEKRK